MSTTTAKPLTGAAAARARDKAKALEAQRRGNAGKAALNRVMQRRDAKRSDMPRPGAAEGLTLIRYVKTPYSAQGSGVKDPKDSNTDMIMGQGFFQPGVPTQEYKGVQSERMRKPVGGDRRIMVEFDSSVSPLNRQVGVKPAVIALPHPHRGSIFMRVGNPHLDVMPLTVVHGQDPKASTFIIGGLKKEDLEGIAKDYLEAHGCYADGSKTDGAAAAAKGDFDTPEGLRADLPPVYDRSGQPLPEPYTMIKLMGFHPQVIKGNAAPRLVEIVKALLSMMPRGQMEPYTMDLDPGTSEKAAYTLGAIALPMGPDIGRYLKVADPEGWKKLLRFEAQWDPSATESPHQALKVRNSHDPNKDEGVQTSTIRLVCMLIADQGETCPERPNAFVRIDVPEYALEMVLGTTHRSSDMQRWSTVLSKFLMNHANMVLHGVTDWATTKTLNGEERMTTVDAKSLMSDLTDGVVAEAAEQRGDGSVQWAYKAVPVLEMRNTLRVCGIPVTQEFARDHFAEQAELHAEAEEEGRKAKYRGTLSKERQRVFLDVHKVLPISSGNDEYADFLKEGSKYKVDWRLLSPTLMDKKPAEVKAFIAELEKIIATKGECPEVDEDGEVVYGDGGKPVMIADQDVYEDAGDVVASLLTVGQRTITEYQPLLRAFVDKYQTWFANANETDMTRAVYGIVHSEAADALDDPIACERPEIMGLYDQVFPAAKKDKKRKAEPAAKEEAKPAKAEAAPKKPAEPEEAPKPKKAKTVPKKAAPKKRKEPEMYSSSEEEEEAKPEPETQVSEEADADPVADDSDDMEVEDDE